MKAQHSYKAFNVFYKEDKFFNTIDEARKYMDNSLTEFERELDKYLLEYKNLLNGSIIC